MSTQKYGGFSDRYEYVSNNPNAVCRWARPSVSSAAWVTDPVTLTTTLLTNGNGVLRPPTNIPGSVDPYQTIVDQYTQDNFNRWGGFLVNTQTTKNQSRTATAITDFIPGGTRHSYTQFRAGMVRQVPSRTSFVQLGAIEFTEPRQTMRSSNIQDFWAGLYFPLGQDLAVPQGPQQFVNGLYSSKNQHTGPVDRLRLKGFGAYSGFSVLVDLPNFCFFALPRPTYIPSPSIPSSFLSLETPWITARSTRGFGTLVGSAPTPIPTPPPGPCVVDAFRCKPVLLWDPIVDYTSLTLHPVFPHIYPYPSFLALNPSNAFLSLNYTDYNSSAVGSPTNEFFPLRFGHNNARPNPYPFGRTNVSTFDHETVPFYLNTHRMITPSANLLDTDPDYGSIITIPRGGYYGIVARIRFQIIDAGNPNVPNGPYDYFEAEVSLELQNSEAPTYDQPPPALYDPFINGIWA